MRHVFRLSDDDIRKEAVRMIKRQMEQEAAEEYKRQLLYEQQQKEEQAVRNLVLHHSRLCTDRQNEYIQAKISDYFGESHGHARADGGH